MNNNDTSLVKEEKLMTIKQLSDVLGVSRDLIEKRVKEVYPGKMKKGVTTKLNEMECTFIKMRIQENSSIATSDDRRKLVEMPQTNLERKMVVQQAMMILSDEINELKTQLAIQAPKVEYHDEVLDTSTSFTTQQIAEELGMTAQGLNKKLKDLRIQYKKSGQWMLYVEHKGKGYTKTRTKVFTRSSGKNETNHYTVWTEKGRKFLHEVISG